MKCCRARARDPRRCAQRRTRERRCPRRILPRTARWTNPGQRQRSPAGCSPSRQWPSASGAAPDSTNLSVGLSITSTSLSFVRDNDRFVAGYTVGLTLRRGGVVVRDIEAHETVRVVSFKETERIDESIVFQQGLTAPPGQYALAVSVRDDGTGRNSRQEMLVTVPRLGASRSLSTPVPFLRVVPRRSRAAIADLVSNPRATAVFGRDSSIALYVEGYGEGNVFPVSVAARNDEGRVLWRDSTSLPRRGELFSGVVTVPVSKVGIGVAVISMWPTGSADTVIAPVFVAFGEELPVGHMEITAT